MMQSMSSSTSNAGNSSNADKFSSTTIGSVLDQLATEPDRKETWNGDVEYSTVVPKNAGLRDELFSKLLGLKQQLTDNDPENINLILSDEWQNCTSDINDLEPSLRREYISLMCVFIFFTRAIRCQGNRSKEQFYALFKRLRTTYPSETLALVDFIPHYGSFEDLNNLLDFYLKPGNEDLEMKSMLVRTFVKAIRNDLCQVLSPESGPAFSFSQLLETENVNGKSLPTFQKLIPEMNSKLKAMSKDELKSFVSSKKLSLSMAGKWIPREGKKHNPEIRFEITKELFEVSYESAKVSWGQLMLRNTATTLTQLLNVVEHNMTNATSRGWADIENPHSIANKKYRLALLNQTKDGDERTSNEDRKECAKKILQAAIDGKLNGAQNDLRSLADLIQSKISRGGYCYSSNVNCSKEERTMIGALWKGMVDYVNNMIAEVIEKDLVARKEAEEAGEDYLPILDPRAVIPIVDVSGSMSGAGVMFYAILTGIMLASISTIREGKMGKLITFSETPEVFSFDVTDDIFNIVAKVMNCEWGYNTNIDATYSLLLGEMVKFRNAGNEVDTQWRLVFLTDGQFDHMVKFQDDYRLGDTQALKGMDTFNERQSEAFNSKGFNVPLNVYWNMNVISPSFPAQSDSKGVVLVAGFSQTIAVEVMTGDYSVAVEEDGTTKVQVTPLESFLRTMGHESFEPIREKLSLLWGDADSLPKPPGESNVMKAEMLPPPDESEVRRQHVAKLKEELKKEQDIIELEEKLASMKADSKV